MRSDEELMKAVSSGEFEAYEELVRRYQNLALSIAYNLLNDSDSAEDVAQEAFLKILRNAEEYEPTASFKTYLGRIVSRLCYDRTEKNRPLNVDPVESGEFSGNTSSDENPLGDLIEDERKQKVRDALEELPERQRTAIVLQNLEDFTYEEIADSMGTSRKAVERLLARARKTLSKSLSDVVTA